MRYIGQGHIKERERGQSAHDGMVGLQLLYFHPLLIPHSHPFLVGLHGMIEAQL